MKITLNISKKITTSEILYFAALGLFIFRYVILFYSEYSNKISGSVHNAFYISIIMILLLKIFNDRVFIVQKLGVIVWSLIVILGTLIGIHLFELNFVATVLLIGLGYNIEFRKIVKFECVELIILCVFVLLSCKIGVINDVIRYKGGIERHGLGFTYIGGIGAFYLSILCMILYIKGNNTSFKMWVTLLLIEIFIYCQDRFVGNLVLASFVLLCDLFFVILNINMFKGIVGRIVRILSYLLAPALALFSILLPLLYSIFLTKNFIALDFLLNGRLAIPARVIKNYGLHLFGINIQTVGLVAVENGINISNYNYIDNGFLNIFIRYGLIFGVAICGVYTKLLIDLVREKKTFLVIWCFAILIQSIIYSYLLSIPNNPLIILAVTNIVRFRIMKNIERNIGGTGLKGGTI